MRLLVVGGRLQGVEAAYLAKKAGFWVRVVDRKAIVPAMDLGDEFLQVDVTTSGGLEAAAQGIDLILPAMENQDALRALTDAAPGLGIPLAFDPDAYAVSRSKQASDRLFAKNDIPVPPPWPACGFPVVVKPSEGSGSEGVTLLADAAAWRKYFKEGFSPEGMVVQQHLEGPSFSVEVIGHPGNYKVLPATELEMDAIHDCKRVLAPSGLSPEAVASLAAIGRACAEALELTGIMDVEVIQHEGDFKVLEVDARLPSQTPITVLHSSGHNEVALLAELFQNGAGHCIKAHTDHRGVIFEHIAVADHRLKVSGERIMAVEAPLQRLTDFFGADEALTTYTPDSDSWVATLIITGANRVAAREKRTRVMANLNKAFGLKSMLDPVPEVPWLKAEAP